MEEIYKDIPGCNNSYQVSNMGNAKSFKWGKERLMKLNLNNDGYLNVNIYLNGKLKNYKVHKLVAMVFLGHTPNGYETVVNHIDNNPLNNNVNNLELVSPRYNTSCHRNDPGVCFYKRLNKWQAQIQIEGKLNYLGVYTDKQDALDAYQKALNELNDKTKV